MIQGQDILLQKINSKSLDSFPRSLMLVGDVGSGRHQLCNYIADKFSLTQLDITGNLDVDFIEELYNRVEPYLYTIRVNELSVKDENSILKFIEEPLKNSFIILIAETTNGLLSTIINRCQIWYLQNYTEDFLRQFLNGSNDSILEVATTPGQVLALREQSFESMIQLADTIITKIKQASVSNTLTLSNKISFKDSEQGKFDLKLFVDVLLSRIMLRWRNNIDISLVSAYNLTVKLKNNLKNKNFDRKSLFEHYLLELRMIMIGGTK